MHARLHWLAEQRSLAIHRAIATLVEADPSLRVQAAARVREWAADGRMATHYADTWLGLLSGPLASLLALLCDEGERGRELRQSSPFVGIIDPRTRWGIWRDTRRASGL